MQRQPQREIHDLGHWEKMKIAQGLGHLLANTNDPVDSEVLSMLLNLINNQDATVSVTVPHDS